MEKSIQTMDFNLIYLNYFGGTITMYYDLKANKKSFNTHDSQNNAGKTWQSLGNINSGTVGYKWNILSSSVLFEWKLLILNHYTNIVEISPTDNTFPSTVLGVFWHSHWNTQRIQKSPKLSRFCVKLQKKTLQYWTFFSSYELFLWKTYNKSECTPWTLGKGLLGG